MALPDSSLDWRFRLDVLRRRRRVIVWTALAALVVAEAFVLGLPNLYRSSATLLVEGRLPDGVGGANDVNARLQSIKQEALSRSRLTDLIERFDLYGAQGKGTGECFQSRFEH